MRAVAVLLLAASARLPHAGQDDRDCLVLFAPGSAADGAALVQGSEAPTPPDHCAICHWTRLLRSPLSASSVTVASDGPATTVLRQDLPLHADPVRSHLPARAPPASRL